MATPLRKLNWGIISTGGISHSFAKDSLEAAQTVTLLAVASRTKDKADAFADLYGIPRRYADYQALLDDPDVEVVYISTPHPQHKEWVLKAAAAKKHILVEKPIGMNLRETEEMVAAARSNDVFLVEAFMGRMHDATDKLAEMVAGGTIGKVKVLRATFTIHPGHYDLKHRLFNKELGGGGILDLGCYPVELVRRIAGAANGKHFEDPTDVQGFGKFGPDGVDEYTVAIATFPSGIVAQLMCSPQLYPESELVIYGEDGYIRLPNNPYHPGYSQPAWPVIVKKREKQESETIEFKTGINNMAVQADHVAAYIDRRESPAMSLDDTIGNMRTLDMWRKAIGLVYDCDA